MYRSNEPRAGCVSVAFVERALATILARHGRGYVRGNDLGPFVGRGPDPSRPPNLLLFNAPPDDENTVPSLVVEVVSPSDRPGRTHRRIQQYTEAGVLIVWLVDCEDQTATV